MALDEKVRKIHIVGIGASAGGIEAITQLVSHLRVDLPCTYVVLQHISPDYRSMMAEILSRETQLKVKELKDGDVPKQGTIFVVPAKSNARIQEGVFHLVASPPEIVPKPSINQFFISLAAEEGEAAIGIILSGTGSDGVVGLQAIQAAGGFTLVQDPETAKYDGMPRSAIEANVADHILPPSEIAQFLPKLLDIPDLEDQALRNIDPIQKLLSYLNDQLRLDFTGYKLSTLMRRIRRRQYVTDQLDLSAYLKLIEVNPEELKHLARDMLISVTAFFRDQQAFIVLEQTIQEIVKHKSPGSEIRVWVAGCASGEEAYSVAILFADILGDRLSQYRIQIFATDIDNDAMNIARRGIYPAASMVEIPPDKLDTYFRVVGQNYEVEKVLRDIIIFARHNLVSDPPFLRLDLITCRNVLIYFDTTLQRKVLQAFHFGLLPKGYLFLGKSESVAYGDSLFSQINRRERVFQKKGEATSTPSTLPSSTIGQSVQRKQRRLELLLTGLVEHFQLTAAICDDEGNILHSAGEVDRYLQFPAGSTGFGLTEVVIPDLRGEVLTLFRRCQVKHLIQKGRRRRINGQLLHVIIEPILDNLGNELYLFLIIPEAAEVQIEAEPLLLDSDQQLENELTITREHLQSLIEELATANEEMQALNEEAQASNEELQATNEELEAANEELQASNEELVSLNEELNVRSSELLAVSEEYAHLYDSLEFPVLVFDRNFVLTRFNVAAERRFNLHLTSLKQPFSRLKLPDALANLEAHLNDSLAYKNRSHFMTELDNRHFQITVTPGLVLEGIVGSLVVSFIDVHDIVHTQAALQESEHRLTSLMENTTIIFAMKDMNGLYTYANRRFIEFFGLQDKEVIGKTDFMLFDHALASLIWNADIQAVRTKEIVGNEYQINLDSTAYYLLANHQALCDTFGNPVALIIEAEDITSRKHAEEQLRITARVFDQTAVAIIVTDSKGRIMTINNAFTQITGYDQKEIINTSVETLLKSGQKKAKNFFISISRSLKERGFWQGELWVKHKNDPATLEWITINRVASSDPSVDYHVAVISDVSSIRNSQRKAEYLAAHDVLTGLPNRVLFQDRLSHALAQARRKREKVALMFIDLDNFKNINDTLGHDIGDELLKQVANRLKQITRDVDTVARLGGDEFTAILTDCNSQSAAYVGQRIIEELSVAFIIQQRQLYVSASIGIAFYPEDGNDNSSLIKAADTAMYRAKELGRNRVEFFIPDLHMQLLKRTTLETALRTALGTHHLYLVYQPKFSISSNRTIIGAEALLRWSDPKLGNITPAEFIPISESSGLIIDLTKEVLRMLIDQVKKWLQLAPQFPPVVFNCSARAMREQGMGEFIIHALKNSAVSSSLIQIEITECTLLENSPAVISNLNLLHQNGIDISIDDFGTGYSSLAYLKRLPLSELKIDKSFIDGLGEDQDDEAISLAILSLAHALDLRSVAEGVETEKQYAWLAKHGCKAVQGYYLSRPLEANQFENLLFSQCDE